MTSEDRNVFFVKEGYIPRSQPQFFVDSLVESAGKIHQPHVYPLAGYLGTQLGCTTIIDIGCGTAKQLTKLHPEFQLIGLDSEFNIQYCRKNYRFGKWIEFDLERPMTALLPKEVLENSIIVCSETIERLINPANLLITLKTWMNTAPLCLITTPERDLGRGEHDHGPPATPYRAREWNMKEFEDLLHACKFQTSFIGLTANNAQDFFKETTLAVIEKNIHCPYDFNGKAFQDFRVLAIMAAYNEEDIIAQSIHQLLQQGIDVHVMDNWSTDNTFHILKDLEKQKLISLERFPKDGPSPYFEMLDLMARKVQISKEMKADWYIHHDVDEIRNSPWRNLNLKQGIFRVDQEGYNAIDHTLIWFQPVDDGFSAGMDFGNYFKYFEFDRVPHCPHVKVWKNIGQDLNLVTSGGHQARFEGRKVYPYKFLLKHYPFRTKSQATKKVFKDRKPRWSPRGRKRGFHIQYDHIEEGFNFIQSELQLERFEEEQFAKQYLVERISAIGIWDE